jgi:hypothetical protein
MHEPSDGAEGYNRRRLRRDHPELYARVLSGELSEYAAGVEAGFRPRMRSVNITTPETAIRALCRLFSADELRVALDAIEDRRTTEVVKAVAQANQAIDEARAVMRDPEARR